MASNINWASRVANQGLDLSTCQYLRFVYSIYSGSSELTEKEIKDHHIVC